MFGLGPTFSDSLKFRNRLLMGLHKNHFGLERMKAIIRTYYWWPSIELELEAMVARCIAC